jgi:Ca2+-binding RTX toxin-like protein
VAGIVVTGTGEQFVLDLGGGPFAPGAEVEATGISEIEFDLSGLTGFWIIGTPGRDTIAVGVEGVNLNDDDDADLITTATTVKVLAEGGNDVVDGSGDPVVGAAFGGSLHVSGGPGRDRIQGGVGNDILEGEDGSDALLGRGGDDLVTGGAAADTLYGGFGRDALNGKRGDDRIVPGPGIDKADGAGGSDTLDFSDVDRGSAINFTTGKTRGDGHDLIRDFERAIGTRREDILVGDRAANVLVGGPGFDRIHGGWREDRLVGGRGRDIIDGGDGEDRVLGGPYNDALHGDDGDDRLFGQDGNDFLEGGPGIDSVDGGPGKDNCAEEDDPGPRISCERP